MVHLYQSLKNTIKFGYQPRIIEDSLGNTASNFGLIYKFKLTNLDDLKNYFKTS